MATVGGQGTSERVHRCGHSILIVIRAGALALAALWTPPAHAGVTILASASSGGDQGDKASKRPAISGDGRYVAFDSNATTLVPDDTNGAGDIFVYDRETGKTARVSVASDGTQGKGASPYPSISEDGRYVAFHSGDSSLVPGDTNGKTDVFVHDRQTGKTTRVSVSSDGAEGNAASKYPWLSGGRYLAFESSASSLVPGDSNGQIDIFVRDRQTAKTIRVSVASDGTESNGASRYPSISRDGRYVAFLSAASNLVPDDTNEVMDIFVHDRQTGKTTRASVTSDGTQADAGSSRGAISGDGRCVAFYCDAANLVRDDTNKTSDVFVYELETGKTTRVSVASDGTQGNGGSRRPKISGDSRYVVFWSLATNLVPGDTNGTNDIFVHDRETGRTIMVSVAGDGTQGNGKSGYPSISADGRWVAFQSGATNLVTGDENARTDVFVHQVQMDEAAGDVHN